MSNKRILTIAVVVLCIGMIFATMQITKMEREQQSTDAFLKAFEVFLEEYGDELKNVTIAEFPEWLRKKKIERGIIEIEKKTNI
jgi:hypothetical protein